MKKLIYIFILLLIPFTLTACTKKTDQPSTQDTGAPQERPDDGEDESTSGSLLDILKMGKNVKCTGSYKDDEGSMDMTVYAAGERSYTESTMTNSDGESYNLYSIFDGEWYYNWGDMFPMATKVKVSDVEDLSDRMYEPEESDSMMEEMDETMEEGKMPDVDYSCSPWIVDNKKFVPPSDIEFSDMNEVMDQMTEEFGDFNSEEMKQQVCEACNMLPDGDQKTECLSSNNCK